jgi:hypothetical protein
MDRTSRLEERKRSGRLGHFYPGVDTPRVLLRAVATINNGPANDHALGRIGNGRYNSRKRSDGGEPVMAQITAKCKDERS